MELRYLMVLCHFYFSYLSPSEGQGSSSSGLYKAYRGCGFVKTCVKICQNSGTNDECESCIKNRNCPALVTIRHERGRFISQMLLRGVGSGSVYISMGIAHQKSMLNAPYVACVFRIEKSDRERVVMFSGYTAQDYTLVYYFDTSEPKQHIFYNKKVETIPVVSGEDPALYCEFTWKTAFEIPELPAYKKFNMSSQPYFIIAATGNAGDNVVSDWALNNHAHTDNGRVITDHSRLMNKIENTDLDYDEDYDCEASVCGRSSSLKSLNLTMLSIISVLVLKGSCFKL